jgi:tetratricopeptide (TPR) repeat protein
MAEAIRGLKQEIAALEKQLKAARIAKQDPETIRGYEEQLALLQRQVAMMENQGRQMARMPAAVQQAATEQPGKAGLPKRDSKRIAAVPDRTLTEAELAAFVKTVASEAERLLSAKQRAEALKIHAGLKAEKRSPDYVANVATSLWLSGYPELAVLIQGKESAADPGNINNLNNYAAFLTMSGAEHAALPILRSLDARFPDNSTILNNLGQAWFGLGEVNRAEQFLDRALAAYPRHVQANMTRSRIQEAQGRTGEAIQSVKRAIEEHYTAEKEQRVTDLGGTVTFEEIPFPYPRPRPWPPLGVEKFWNAIPPYPFTAADAEINARRWQEFREQLQAARERLQPEIDAANARWRAAQQRIMADPRRLLPYNNPVHNTALRKRAALGEWAQDRLLRLTERAREVGQQVDGWRSELDAVLRNPDASCGAKATAAVRFLQQANGAYRDQNAAMVDFLQQFTGGPLVALNMYAASDPTEYEWLLAAQKSEILTFLGGLPYAWAPVCDAPVREPGLRQPLPDFDEANCAYRDRLYIPPFTTITTECNKMTTDFDVSDLGLKVKVGWSENLNSGKLTRGTLELGAGLELASASAGPFSAEVKAAGAVGIEVTPDGVKEVYVKASVTGEVESDMAKGMSAEVGKVEVKSSWNAGPSATPGRAAAPGPTPLSAIRWSAR